MLLFGVSFTFTVKLVENSLSCNGNIYIDLKRWMKMCCLPSRKVRKNRNSIQITSQWFWFIRVRKIHSAYCLDKLFWM